VIIDDDASESLVLVLQRTTHLTLHALSTRLAHLGLTPGEINAIANLAERDDQTVSELSKSIGTPASTMTSLLDRLAKRALITRRTPESNRRTVVVSLTPAGRTFAVEARTAMSEIDAELGARLTESDVTTLRRMLQALSTEPS